MDKDNYSLQLLYAIDGNEPAFEEKCRKNGFGANTPNLLSAVISVFTKVLNSNEWWKGAAYLLSVNSSLFRTTLMTSAFQRTDLRAEECNESCFDVISENSSRTGINFSSWLHS